MDHPNVFIVCIDSLRADCVGPDTEALIRNAAPGSVILLENLRFHAGEETNDPDFSRRLAGLADCYVNDAFGTAHRAHASIDGMTEYFRRPAAGLLMQKEIEYLSRVMEAPARPFITLIGGGKVSHKAAVIENLLPKVDRLLVGGGAVFNFLKARRAEIGKSIYEPDMVKRAGELATDHKLVLPADIVVAPGPDAGADAVVVPVNEIPSDRMGLDIGPATARLYADVLRQARTIVWAGPMGVFEQDAFAHGSEAVARAIAEATGTGAVSVAGGGDTIACLVRFGLLDRVSHASTGGGACLDFLAGKSLPGITALHKEE